MSVKIIVQPLAGSVRVDVGAGECVLGGEDAWPDEWWLGQQQSIQDFSSADKCGPLGADGAGRARAGKHSRLLQHSGGHRPDPPSPRSHPVCEFAWRHLQGVPHKALTREVHHGRKIALTNFFPPQSYLSD